jgi:UDP-3-O-[3-hydroxymyristoyl] glucosamine N-acyltransferase
MKSLSLKQIATLLDIEVVGPEDLVLTGVATLDRATPNDLTFLHTKDYAQQAHITKAGACLTSARYRSSLPPSTLALVTPKPYEAFVLIALQFCPPESPTGIHPTASIDPSAIIGEGCSIGAYAVIGKEVILGPRCSIGPQCTLEHTTLGENVVLKSGARIGQIGFGFIMKESGMLSVPHFGRVLIGDHTFIGANTTVDRGSFGDTVIGKHCRIDNLVQIAHNVVVGDSVVMAAQCGISGSTHIGSGSMLGGQVGISGHVVLAPGTQVAAKSGVMRSTKPGEKIAGIPAGPLAQWRRRAVEAGYRRQSE